MHISLTLCLISVFFLSDEKLVCAEQCDGRVLDRMSVTAVIASVLEAVQDQRTRTCFVCLQYSCNTLTHSIISGTAVSSRLALPLVDAFALCRLVTDHMTSVCSIWVTAGPKNDFVHKLCSCVFALLIVKYKVAFQSLSPRTFLHVSF